MKRLLCIVGGMNRGGAETFLMKVYRKLNKACFQMDFAVAEDGVYDNEIFAMGGRIFRITPKSDSIFKNFNDIKHLVSKEQYKYVLRLSQHSLSALELLAAKLGGAKVCIYRSSNSNTGSPNKVNQLLHRLFLFMPRHFANIRIAPSTEAAVFMFGKDYIEKKKVTIIQNGLDLDTFIFSDDSRKRIRQSFLINNENVIGHIGRFTYQKNHEFLINIFYEYNKKVPNSKLLLVGIGELKQDIELKVRRMGLQDKVIFAGLRNDIPELLSAMDLFIFPSRYEGMPNTVLEAQAVGLPCVISDSITKECNITGLVSFISPTEPAKIWAQKILSIHNTISRKDTHQNFIDNGYDISSTTEKFLALLYS